MAALGRQLQGAVCAVPAVWVCVHDDCVFVGAALVHQDDSCVGMSMQSGHMQRGATMELTPAGREARRIDSSGAAVSEQEQGRAVALQGSLVELLLKFVLAERHIVDRCEKHGCKSRVKGLDGRGCD